MATEILHRDCWIIQGMYIYTWILYW